MKYNGEKKCPVCGQPIYGYTAISRKDNKTEICDNCGSNEAMNNFLDYLSSNTEKDS